jgi:phenylacetate-CoA ligase
MILEPKFECMPRADLEQLQTERLQATLFRARQNVAFYRHALAEDRADISEVRTLSDLRRLPFTTKDDLKANYPYDMFAVPLHDVVRIHSTSGTTGKPIVVGHTRNDVQHWTNLVARVLASAGVDQRDFVQVCFHYGQASAALGFHYGAERLGACVIPASGESASRQVMVMRDYRTSVLVSTPSYALHLAQTIEDLGVPLSELNLRAGIFGAEPWSERMRAEIERRLGLTAIDNYGLTELAGPGVSFECERREGLHVNEDHYLVEVIDPATLEPVPDGQEGEVVFTTLTREAFPLIRYRTGDIASIISEPCPCGRSTRRLTRLSGRTDDMIIVEGVNIFPSQIEESILGVEGLRPNYQIVLDRKDGNDSISIQVEASSDFPFLDELGQVERLKSKLEGKLKEELGLRVSVTLVEPRSLGSSDGRKFRRILDRRDK